MAMFAMAKKPSTVPLLFPSANQPIMRKTPAAQSAILGMPSTIQMQKSRWKDMCRKKRPYAMTPAGVCAALYSAWYQRLHEPGRPTAPTSSATNL